MLAPNIETFIGCEAKYLYYQFPARRPFWTFCYAA